MNIFLCILYLNGACIISTFCQGKTFVGISEYNYFAGIVVRKGFYIGRASTKPLQNDSYVCGCTIVASIWVTTATECVNWMEPAGIRPVDVVIRNGVSRWIDKVHEREVVKMYFKDRFNITMIKVKNHFDVVHTTAIAIASSRYRYHVGEYVTTYGFAAIENLNRLSDRLKKATIEILNPSLCREPYRAVPPELRIICAGGPEVKNFYTKDCGGPLVHNGVLLGVVIGGYTKPDNPVVSVFLGTHQHWLENFEPGNLTMHFVDV